MKRFLIRILTLFLILFLCDRVAGIVFGTWLGNVDTSGLGKDNYISDFCTDDILIFGSSRAESHYNAKMIEDSLGMTAYNCGTDGSGIILSYGRLLMLSRRYHPRFVIMEITPEFDLYENKNNHSDLGKLKRYYDRPGIREIFDRVEPDESIKMQSHFYRYNSDFAHNPLKLFTKQTPNKNARGVQGFVAGHQIFDKMKVGERKAHEDLRPDPDKQFYFREFVRRAREFSEVVFVVSPYWQGRDPDVYHSVHLLADSLHIPFFDFSNSRKYYHQDEYFKDGSHLNYIGADEFTRDLIDSLRQIPMLRNCNPDTSKTVYGRKK